MNLNKDTLQALWELAKAQARDAINQAFERLPGPDTDAREQYAIDYVLARVESVDQLLPAIGVFMDLPLVDMGERVAVTAIVRRAIRALVRREYDAMKIEQEKENL